MQLIAFEVPSLRCTQVLQSIVLRLAESLCFDSAAMSTDVESTPPRNTPLPELVGGSAGFGSWKVKVCGHPKERDYTYKWDGKTIHGKSFTVLLVSSDTTQYCYGKFTRRGKEPKASAAFKNAAEKFQDGTVWLITKPTLAKEKTLYIAADSALQ